MRQSELFGLSEHLERLSKHGDPLEVLEATVDFEHFRGWLVAGLGYGDGARGGHALTIRVDHSVGADQPNGALLSPWNCWCPGADSNHRHANFQSAALPN